MPAKNCREELVSAVADHYVASMAKENSDPESATIIVRDESAVKNSKATFHTWRLDQTAGGYADWNFDGAFLTTITTHTGILHQQDC